MARDLRQPRRPRRRPARSERGAALLMAVVSVAMLTALAVDLAYETQVRLRIAANARDELRAQALAQSAVTMSRLVLSMQQQVDLTCTAAGVGLPPGGPALPCPQVWNMVPVSSVITQSLFADTDGPGATGKAAAAAKPSTDAPGAPALQTTSLAGFQGGYEARIEDEGQKINVQLGGLSAGGVLAIQVESLLRMMCDSKWDPLFDRTDAEGQRYSRADLVTNLRDWTDDLATVDSLVAAFPGGNCSFVVDQNPFQKGFSDENVHYDRGTDRYRTKNARFDSLEELHLVAGITDPFMAAFGDQLTVYMPQNPKINVNSTDPRRQVQNAQTVADVATRPKLSDPTIQAAWLKLLNVETAGGLLNISPQTWVQRLESLGVKVRSEFLSSTSPLTDKSPVFRIRARGVAGDVTHEIDAVVTYNQDDLPAEDRMPSQGIGSANPNKPRMGALIHWRED